MVNNFGLLFTIKYKFVAILLKLFSKSRILNNYKQSLIKKYLTSVMDIKKYYFEQYDDNRIPKIIWVFWSTGIDNAPDIVKACRNSVSKNTDCEIRELDLNNYQNYIKLPDVIENKFKHGKIKYVHFADILRVFLLAQYGGIWIDSTIFFSKMFDDDIFNYRFYSNKINLSDIKYISRGRWSSFFLCSAECSPIFATLRDLYTEYWNKFDTIIDYLLIDYFIDITYDIYPYEFDLIPINNEDIYILGDSLNKSGDLSTFTFSKTFMYKLSFKEEFVYYSTEGLPTLYSCLLYNYLT